MRMTTETVTYKPGGPDSGGVMTARPDQFQQEGRFRFGEPQTAELPPSTKLLSL